MQTLRSLLILGALGALGALCAVGASASAARERSPDPGSTTLTTSPASLEIDLGQGRPMARFTVDGHGPYDFIVDTGAGASVLDDGLASQLGLPQVGQQVLHSPGSSEGVEGRLVQVERIEGGGLRIERPVLVTADLAGLSAGTIDGVLGRAHFAELLLTFDYPASRIVVDKGSLDAADPGVLGMDLAQGAVRVHVDLADRSFPMDLDSGSPGGFTLPKRLDGELAWRSRPQPGPTIRLLAGSFESWLGELDGTIGLGGLSYRNPRIVLTTYADDHGNIGFQVLRELRITLDQASGLVALARPAAATPEAGAVVRRDGPAGPPRLGVRFAMTPGGFVRQRGGLVVQEVDDGSPAAVAGLQAGDVVVEVGGEAVAGVETGGELAALLRGPRPLGLVVLRGDRRVEITVP